jgi:hypothetical protein
VPKRSTYGFARDRSRGIGKNSSDSRLEIHRAVSFGAGRLSTGQRAGMVIEIPMKTLGLIFIDRSSGATGTFACNSEGPAR